MADTRMFQETRTMNTDVTSARLVGPPARSALSMATLAALCLTGAAPAAAALVQVDFSVTIDTTTSPLFGTVHHGSLAYDDASGVAGPGAETWYGLTRFAFAFDGVTLALADLAFADAVHDDGLFAGLEAVQHSGLFAFVPGLGGQPASFAFDLGGGHAGYGAISYRVLPSGQIDAPPTWVLLTLPLAALAWAGRRRGARS